MYPGSLGLRSGDEELELAVLYLIATLVLLVRPTGIFGKTS